MTNPRHINITNITWDLHHKPPQKSSIKENHCLIYNFLYIYDYFLYTHIQIQKHQDEHIAEKSTPKTWSWQAPLPQNFTGNPSGPAVFHSKLQGSCLRRSLLVGKLWSRCFYGRWYHDLRCQLSEILLILHSFFWGVGGCRMLLVFTSHWRQPKYTWDIPLPTSRTIYLHIWATSVTTKAAGLILMSHTKSFTSACTMTFYSPELG